MPEKEDNPKTELIRASVEVVKTAYDDALKPIASQAGMALGTVGRTVNVALSPLRAVVWSFEQIESFICSAVSQKLEARRVSPDKITTPDPDVAVPSIEAMRYSKLKNEFANLLATAMNSASVNEAHPSFVEILKQLTPFEALILQRLPDYLRYEPLMNLRYRTPNKGEFTLAPNITCLDKDSSVHGFARSQRAIDNLFRLGLIDIPPLRRLSEDWRYDGIRALSLIKDTELLVPEGGKFFTELGMVGLSITGDAFRNACIDRIT